MFEFRFVLQNLVFYHLKHGLPLSFFSGSEALFWLLYHCFSIQCLHSWTHSAAIINFRYTLFHSSIILFSRTLLHMQVSMCSFICIQKLRNIIFTLPCRQMLYWCKLFQHNLSFMQFFWEMMNLWHISSPRFYFA